MSGRTELVEHRATKKAYPWELKTGVCVSITKKKLSDLTQL